MSEKSNPESGDDHFPRSSSLPRQSPLFWVQQKDRYLRQRLIRDIEELTGRRFLVLFGNRFVAGSEIYATDIAQVVELFGDAIGSPVDLMLETPGGSTDATEAILSVICQATPDFRAIVPNAAKSNGTLIALHAKTIVMGISSELGPIEPSLSGIPCSTLTMTEVKNSNFPLYVAAVHAMRQTQELAIKALAGGMMSEAHPDNIKKAVDALSTRDTYPVHGSVIDRREAASLGLNVTSVSPGDPFWDRVWLLHCMYDFDSRRNGLAKIFEGRSRSLSVAAIQQTNSA